MLELLFYRPKIQQTIVKNFLEKGRSLTGGSRISHGGPFLEVGARTYYLAKYLSKTAWKWQKIGPREGACPWSPPLRCISNITLNFRRGVPSRGVSAWGCLTRGVPAQGGCLSRGLPAQGRGWWWCIPACIGADSPLWTEWLTDRCKNITFPQLRLRTVTKHNCCHKYIRNSASPLLLKILWWHKDCLEKRALHPHWIFHDKSTKCLPVQNKLFPVNRHHKFPWKVNDTIHR